MWGVAHREGVAEQPGEEGQAGEAPALPLPWLPPISVLWSHSASLIPSKVCSRQGAQCDSKDFANITHLTLITTP